MPGDITRVEYYGYKHWTLEDVPRCFNVGKGLIGRSDSHYARNHKWHAIVNRLGLRVEVCVGPVTNFDACSWEIENITLMGTFSTNHSHDDDSDIGCNFTKGGEGAAGRPVSAETREKIAATQRGEKAAWFGRRHNAVTKRSISMKNTGKVRTLNARTRIASKLVGKSLSERGSEWRHKIGESNSRRRGIKYHYVARIRKMNKVKNQLVLLCGGPDRCGKTNILRELEKRLHVPYFKASQEHENFLHSQDQFLNELRYADPRVADMLYQTGFSILVDRAYMCEWVYAQFFNRETDMRMLRKMDDAYCKLDAKILICTRKSFVGIEDDLDPKLNGEALQKISDLYTDFTKWTKCQTYTLYVDDEDINREVEEILEFIGGPLK